MENTNEFVDIKINKEIYEILKLWNKERKEQIGSKNLGAREAIFKVQTRRKRIINEEIDSYDFAELCIYDGEEYMQSGSVEYFIENINEHWIEDEEKLKKFKQALDGIEDIDRAKDKIEELGYFEDVRVVYFCYYWQDVATFLTCREAEEYQAYQCYNLGVNRIYVTYPGYRNCSSLNKFLEILDHKDIFEVE